MQLHSQTNEPRPFEALSSSRRRSVSLPDAIRSRPDFECLERVCDSSRYAWEREPQAREVIRLMLRTRESDGAAWVELWRWEASRRQFDLLTGDVTAEFPHGRAELIGARLIDIDFDGSDPTARAHPELIERLEGIRATVSGWRGAGGTMQ
jgi:hypothetical protein